MDTQRSQFFNFEITMALYSIAASITVYISIRFLKLLRPFSDENNWTIIREITFILLVLLLIGIALYFSGFAIEGSSLETRLTSRTFFDSLKKGFLLGFLPFAIFSILNYKYLLGGKAVALNQALDMNSLDSDTDVNIASRLKREYPYGFVLPSSRGKPPSKAI